MSSENQARSKQYSKAKEAFSSLGVEERTFFLVESAVATVLEGIRKATDTLSDVVSDVFEGEESADEDRSASGTGAQATGTSQAKKTKTGKTQPGKAKGTAQPSGRAKRTGGASDSVNPTGGADGPTGGSNPAGDDVS